MREVEFIDWCDKRGYRLLNDWNWQEIKGVPHYWIRNHETDRYALIKEYEDCFIVLVEDFDVFGCFNE